MIRVKIEKASDWGFCATEEFASEREMIKWGLEQHQEIIISYPYADEDKKQWDYVLEIYNDYRE